MAAQHIQHLKMEGIEVRFVTFAISRTCCFEPSTCGVDEDEGDGADDDDDDHHHHHHYHYYSYYDYYYHQEEEDNYT